MQVKMTFQKSTKGTHVYTADDPEAAIQTVYVKRDKLPTARPDKIVITLDYGREVPN